jgi:3'-phosphoadenosine 5'-phosphosulfate sulfotransferase (PAPS reductase)/FAD synthetase
MNQTSFLPTTDADELITQVRAEHSPVAAVALFSGGHDSTVLAHRCRDHYDSLAFIDTGTAVPGVREFIVEFAAWLQKPLHILESGDAYRRLVLGLHKQNPPPGWRPYGFPGPAGHNRAYNQLKERQLRVLRRQLQEGHRRGAKVMYLTGLRRGESQRRKRRMPITFHGAIVFVNPLIDWTNDQMRDYRAEHAIPESEPAALLHRSGECNCGSFAAPGEREMLKALYPDWFETTIASLEREAEERGIVACRWGERPDKTLLENPALEMMHGGDPPEFTSELCTDCQLRLEIA